MRPLQCLVVVAVVRSEQLCRRQWVAEAEDRETRARDQQEPFGIGGTKSTGSGTQWLSRHLHWHLKESFEKRTERKKKKQVQALAGWRFGTRIIIDRAPPSVENREQEQGQGAGIGGADQEGTRNWGLM
jgi:hypothetical protein